MTTLDIGDYQIKAVKLHPKPSLALVINAPHFFEDPKFLDWLNNKNAKFTWHPAGHDADEWSDVVVCVDPSLNGEGTDSDMPEEIWDQIVNACKDTFEPNLNIPHIMVRLTNIEEDVDVERPRG